MSQNLSVVGAVFMYSAVSVFIHCLYLDKSRIYAICIQRLLRSVTSPDTCIFIAVNGVNRFAGKQVLGDQVTVGQLVYLLLAPGSGQGRVPCKVLVLYIVGVQYHFHALIAGLGDILPDRQRRTPSGQSAGDGQYTLE